MALADPPEPGEDLRRLRLLIDRLPAMIGYWDASLHNVVANDSYFAHFGTTPDQIRGRHLREVVGETVYARIRSHAEQALQGHPQVFDSTLTDPHGATRHFETSYIPDLVDGTVRGFFVQANDVTARVRAEQARDEALRLFQISVANAPFGQAVLTTAGVALLVNPALCQLVGYTADELAGLSYHDFVHPDELAAAIEEHRQLLAGEVSQISSERRYLRHDGTTIWLQRNAVLAPGGEYGVDDVIIGQFQDVTARRRAEAELARLAVTDQLTGLYNRRELVSRVAQRWRREPDHPVGLIFVDLDGFKQVNDMHGHAAGDVVLVEVARRLRRAVPAPDSVYRLGGDEFIALVPQAATAADVAARATDISAALTGLYDVDTDSFHLTASVGWTWGPADDVEELIRAADTEMYRHKTRLHVSAVAGNKPG
ncbi:hypothetical protein B1R94_13165 [Mycolicibacterium litorale]|nr:hypothetical protein B1R94_13165 [Mycolicibacterium litorale]